MIETPKLSWLDHVRPYVEYSHLIKEQNRFNDSQLLVIGASFTSPGGWFIYSDFAYSNGNDFVGNEGGFGDTSAVNNSNFTSNRLGANPDEDWQARFNLNLGYYF